jgi:hypothetical protein
MAERIYSSVGEMFSELAPDITEFLESKDLFWSRIRENSITDEELDKHQALMEEMGIFSKESAVSRAIQIMKSARKTSLPTPFNIRIK